MTTQDAAEKLGIDESLVRKYCREGRNEQYKGPKIKAKFEYGRWWITETALKRFRRRKYTKAAQGK